MTGIDDREYFGRWTVPPMRDGEWAPSRHMIFDAARGLTVADVLDDLAERRPVWHAAIMDAATGMTFRGDRPPDRPTYGDAWFDQRTVSLKIWNGSDWLTMVTAGDPYRRHPRPDPTHPPGSMVLVVDGSMSDRDARIPDKLRAYRTRMEDTAEHWAAKHGFTIARASWATAPPLDARILVPLRLEVFMTPRTDGVWGQLHDALQQDQEDREEALGAPAPQTAVVPPIVVHIAPDPV